ncbi:M-phase phosphoprotein 8 [Pseudocercospora fuligena]|uniref:M-phase phosphoprotein 8 n=1 Tax=Pseudocercospora fuligena TaxID=685502 RepID=A0A8H6RP67_9PEZI|nr:M-phase phosphoprotein 8 [Pseudocercospora fuligena]
MNQAMNQALIKAMFEEMARLKAEHFVNSTNQALPSPSPSPFTNPTLTPVRPSDKEAGNEQAKVTTPEVSTDGSEMVEVEKIVDERDEDVKVEYRIRWKGFGESDDTWETLEDFENMDEVLEEWEQVKHKRSRIQAKPVEATSKAAGDLITQEGFMKWAMQALMSQKKAQLEAAKNDSTPPPTPQNRTKDSFDGVATGSKQQTSKKKVAEAPNAAADVSTPKKNNPKAAPDTTLAPTTPKAPERRRVRERQVQGTAVTTPASALRTPELRRVRGVQAQKTDATAPGSAHKVPDICKALGAQAEEKASPLVKHNKGKAVETEIQPVQAGANVNDEDFDDEWFGGEM